MTNDLRAEELAALCLMSVEPSDRALRGWCNYNCDPDTVMMLVESIAGLSLQGRHWRNEVLHAMARNDGRDPQSAHSHQQRWLPEGEVTESALLHAIFEAGLRAVRESAEEAGYAEMAASETPEETAEQRRIARRRRPASADED